MDTFLKFLLDIIWCLAIIVLPVLGYAEEGYRGIHWWRDHKVGAELEKAAYEELLTSGKVKYIEITPVPGWINM